MEAEKLIELVKKKHGKVKLVSDEIKALKKGDSNFRYLAEVIISACNDVELAKNLYKIAVEKMPPNFQDTLDLAVSISSTLKDQKWVMDLAKIATSRADTVSDFVGLAQLISDEDRINDKGLAQSFYDLAASAASQTYEFKMIAVSAYNARYLNDEEFARRMLARALDCISDVYDLCSVATTAADKDDFCGDKKWAMQILQDGMSKFKDKDDLNFLKSELEKIK
jgi:hypothetical protein